MSGTFSRVMMRSVSEAPTSGLLWESAKMSLILAPPRAGIPPLALISSAAMMAPALVWIP